MPFSGRGAVQKGVSVVYCFYSNQSRGEHRMDINLYSPAGLRRLLGEESAAPP